jgi:AcrR family transcriptional regulator
VLPAGTTLDDRERLLSCTVALLIELGPDALDLDVVCAASGVDRATCAQWFDSIDSVFVGVSARLLYSHVENPGGSVQPVGDLETALRTALRTIWEHIERRADEHQALHVLMVAQIADRTLIDRMGLSVHDTHLRFTEGWLVKAAQRYGIEWAVEVPQLAILVQALFDGLIADYLIRRDGTQPLEVLDIFAGHLARNALRV